MTRDFAMMAYSNNDADMTSEFTVSVSGVASAWGAWHTTGSVYTNCGPQLCRPPSPTQAMDLAPSGNSHTETVSDEYNQCVFVRYNTVRKRLGIPRVIRAAAGPHDLGPGGNDDEGSLLEAQYDSDSDSDSDIAPSLFDDDGDDDSSSITSIDSEPDIVVHNTTPDERDDFDVIADYVFRNSDAESVLIHHRDIALLREPGDSIDLSVQLIEKRPQITVDENGVGTIRCKADPPTNTRSNGPLGIASPPPLSTPSEVQREATNRMELPEPKPRLQCGESEAYVLPRGSPETWEGSSHASITRLPKALPLIRSPVVRPMHHLGDLDINDPPGGLSDPTQLYLDSQALIPPSQGNAPAPTEEIEDERAKLIREQAEAAMVSQAIDESLQEDRKLIEKHRKATKVLLLGQAESGKSTMLKNLQLSFHPSQSRNEKGTWRSVVEANLFSSLLTILQVIQDARETTGSVEPTSPIPGFSRRNSSIIDSSPGPGTQGIGDEEGRKPILTDPHRRLRTHLSSRVSAEENLNKKFSPHQPCPREVSARGGTNRKPYLTRLAKEGEQNHSRPTSSRGSIPQEDGAHLVTFIEDNIALWSDPVVHRVPERQEYNIRDILGFFLDDTSRIAVQNYEPSDQDITKARWETIGVEEDYLVIGNSLEDNGDWYIDDVGGRQNLRSKWVAFFDDVQAIIFLASLTSNLALEEDLVANRLQDSLAIWKTICSSRLPKRAITNHPMDVLMATFESELRASDYVTSYHVELKDLSSVVNYLKQHFKACHKMVSSEPRPIICCETSVIDTNSPSTICIKITKSIQFWLEKLQMTAGLVVPVQYSEIRESIVLSQLSGLDVI